MEKLPFRSNSETTGFAASFFNPTQPLFIMTTAQRELTDTVEKEYLPYLNFPNADVLHSAEERRQRQHDANRATMLGNNYQGKLDIYFKTADGHSHRVYTTVWASSNEHLTLKSGTSLPLRAVVGFDFY